MQQKFNLTKIIHFLMMLSKQERPEHFDPLT